ISPGVQPQAAACWGRSMRTAPLGAASTLDHRCRLNAHEPVGHARGVSGVARLRGRAHEPCPCIRRPRHLSAGYVAPVSWRDGLVQLDAKVWAYVKTPSLNVGQDLATIWLDRLKSAVPSGCTVLARWRVAKPRRCTPRPRLRS